jgi:hypothetical protein
MQPATTNYNPMNIFPLLLQQNELPVLSLIVGLYLRLKTFKLILFKSSL